MTFFISPLAGILIDSLGLRRTAVLGGAIATVGMLASSFVLAHVEALYFTYGVLFGAGTSLTLNASLVVLGHYFHDRLSFINGIATAGSSVLTVVFPFFLNAALAKIGLSATMQILAGITGLLMVCAVAFVPILPIGIEQDYDLKKNCRSQLLNKYANLSIWKNQKYVIWTIAVSIAMLGYFIPHVHLVGVTFEFISNLLTVK